MAHRPDFRAQHFGVVGLALLGVLLLIAALIIGSWSSGLLTVRSADLSMSLPRAPVLPKRAPNPNPNPNPSPMPLPKPGPGVAER